MTDNERRFAFLAGEGTLTLAEVHRWAQELEPTRLIHTPPPGMRDDEPLAVSVLDRRDPRGLSGAEVIRGAR